MDILELIQQPESKTLEFKENASSKEKILATAIAFANASGGTIIIGVRDKTREIVGVQDPQRLAEALANMIHDSVSPRLLPHIEVISVRGKYVLSVEVFPSAIRPHFEAAKGIDKSTYIRIGPTTRLADADLLKAIQVSSSPKSFDETICHEVSYEDLDHEFISQLFSHLRTIEPNDLVSLGLAVKDNKTYIPTNGGAIMFAKNRLQIFPDAWIQMGAFEGNDKTKIANSQRSTAYFPKAIDEAMEFIRKSLKVGLDISDVRHQEVWEIPRIAIREALINAVVHSDYSLRGAPIRISIFDDRLEIENTALLPWGLKVEDLKTGISKLRNPVIARLFNELGLVEQWGSGIRRIYSLCREAALKEPTIEEIGPRIRVTFYKEHLKEIILEEDESKILEIIKSHGSASTKTIADLMGVSRRTVLNRIEGLLAKKLIIPLAVGPNDPHKSYTLLK